MAAPRIAVAPRRPSLLFWGLLTILVILLAYLLALAIGIACAAASIAVLQSLRNFTGFILVMGAGACTFAILSSLIPRRDKFQPPGVLLDSNAQPRLFAEISSIAGEFSEPLPSSVYLTLEPNAWVAQRGGVLGFGSKRVMAIGLPLLTTMSLSEFRAIIAHEFAHYYGGDTSLGPFIQKAREALARSLQSLSSDSEVLQFMSQWGVVALLRLLVINVFALYWKLFLRLTLLVSRKWEYRADELASAVAGAKPLVSSLEKVNKIDAAWPSFWFTEALPILVSGLHPPLANGFERYIVVPAVAAHVNSSVAEFLAAEKPEAMATHPTFRQRSDRALAHPFDCPPEDNTPALSLFDDLPALERSLALRLFEDSSKANLSAVDWDHLGREYYIPAWTRFVTEYRDLLTKYSIADLPTAVADRDRIGGSLRDPQGSLLTPEQRAERAIALVHAAFSLALVRAGGQVNAPPGEFEIIIKDSKLSPEDIIGKIRQRQMSIEEYRQLVHGLGIDELPLVPESLALSSV